MKRSVLSIAFALCLLQALGQSLTAKITPIEMMIGEQAQVTLTVDASEGAEVQWPVFQPRQQIVPGVEVVSSSTTVANQEEQKKSTGRTMILTLTSFDGNLYHLPPFEVSVNGKKVQSADLALKVVEVEVDTTKLDQFFGPKGVQDNPFQWREWAPIFWFSVLMVVLMAIGLYLYVRLRSNKPIIRHIKIIKRLLPHQKAMKEIEQIKADKMVTSENQKEYYTKLTDTLRRYIEERYGFSAMEMTSTEIIERLMQTDQHSLDELRQLFTTADLVKFAKYSTMINENDANLVSAIDFINQTKLENQPTEEIVKPELSEADQKTKQSRRVLKALIWVVGLTSAALMAYVVYNVYMLLV
ncbi:MAG: BatD family protein [Prevotella sp.]|nr:BatD family protein [Prevotella sp.]